MLVDLVRGAVRAAPPAVPDLGRTKRRAATLRRRRSAVRCAAVVVGVLLVAAVPNVSSHRPSPDPAVVVPSAPPPPTGSVPQCADSDLSLIVVRDQTVQLRGEYMQLTLKIENLSARACSVDLGAREFYLQSGATKMWSSNACDAPHPRQPTTLEPSIEVSYANTWDGKATSHGCTNREIPPAGNYLLFGRLDTKLSEPATVQLT
jgi:hypothetical protein